ncbi:MAG: transcriptional regulator [Actinobacteria bacterium]|nr:transcriptional regulator [Actinomycetota bacterium]
MTTEGDDVGGMGPTELVQAARVARHHYLAGESKVEIAERLGISRFKVARLLDAAHEAGLVRIEIAPVDGLDLDLSARVQDGLELSRCAVLAAGPSAAAEINAALGRTAARLLSEILGPEDVLGLPWSRSVLAMTAHLQDLPPVRVVQLTGAMELKGYDASAVDIVRAAARACGGSASIFHAPFVVDDPRTAESLRRQTSVAQGLALADEVTHAVVGIGQWGPGLSTQYDVASLADRAEASAAGVVGESAGVYFNSRGDPLTVALSERLITISWAQLRAIPQVVAIAFGSAKAQAVRAAVTGGLVNSLVLDADLAAALLAD